MIEFLDVTRIKGTTNYPTSGQIGLIGPSSGGNKIRSEFAALEYEELVGHLADVGDLHRKSFQHIGDILKEFSEAVACTVICTPSPTLRELTDDFWSTYLQPVVVTNRPLQSSVDIGYIGIQRHLFPKEFVFSPQKHVRLGQLRQNIEKSEVMLRNADCIVLDLNALRLSDNLGSLSSSCAGLMVEEFCMIAKYAGASSTAKTIIINGYDQNRDEHGMMAKNIALSLFYILDGFDIRTREINSAEQFQRYSVLPDDYAEELVFIEDQRSGRWWVQLFSEAAEEEVKMACSRQDYEDACNNEISERLTNLLSLV